MYKTPLFPINQKTTNESIRKITEKYNKERDNIKINLDSLKVITKDDSPNPCDNEFILSIICLLSSTTLLYYFFKVSR